MEKPRGSLDGEEKTEECGRKFVINQILPKKYEWSS
jgi:hypothetical protein